MLAIVTPPARAALYVWDVKKHLRITSDFEDVLLQNLVEAVTLWLSGPNGWLGRSLITQTLELSVPYPVTKETAGPYWAAPGCIILPRPPYREIEGVCVLDRAGASWWLSEESYSVDIGSDELARVSFRYDAFHLDPALAPASVVVRYKAGYGERDYSIDAGIRQAMLMTIARLYQNRGDGLAADFREDRFVQSLFAPYRVWL